MKFKVYTNFSLFVALLSGICNSSLNISEFAILREGRLKLSGKMLLFSAGQWLKSYSHTSLIHSKQLHHYQVKDIDPHNKGTQLYSLQTVGVSYDLHCYSNNNRIDCLPLCPMLTNNFIILLTDGLLIVALIGTTRLLSATKSRSSWMLIGLALVILAIAQLLKLYTLYIDKENISMTSFYLLLDLLAASLLAIGVIRIGKILRQVKKMDAWRIESETRFKLLFDNSGDEIFLADFEGNIIEINQEAVRQLGYSKEELMQMNFKDLKTPKYIPLVQKNIDIILQQGQHVYVTEHITHDGNIIFLEMSSRVIDYFGRKAILSIARDITERTEMERKISAAIIETEERERKRFAADLHDGLAPLLSTIKLYTDLLKKGNLTKITPAEALESVEALVDNAIVSTREISNNIMPSILQDFGLVAAINDFCNFINKSQSLKIILDLDQYALPPPRIEETILFQSVKELVNNTIKHASAETIEIFLENHDRQVNLLYKDDGKGFNVDEKTQQTSGWGLNNIVNKIKTVNGLTMIKSRPGQGMSVLISLKVSI